MARLTQYRWVLPLCVCAALAADQGSKWLLRRVLPDGALWAPVQSTQEWLHLRVGANPGAAFGLFPGAGAVFVWAAVAAIAYIAWLYARQPTMPVPIAAGLGLIAGGAAGNLLDRLYLGGAVDFIHVGPLPAFNLADGCIVAGAVVLAVGRFLRH